LPRAIWHHSHDFQLIPVSDRSPYVLECDAFRSDDALDPRAADNPEIRKDAPAPKDSRRFPFGSV
jgi:hypothetical protein